MSDQSKRKMRLTLNQLMANYSLVSRRALLAGEQEDPRRDLDDECGYPQVVGTEAYKRQWDRSGLAQRVVKIYPEECFAVDPVIYETERPRDTPFEKAWKSLCRSEEANPLHYLQRVDVLSGIGRFGVLLLGTDDGGALDTPLPGINLDGTPNAETKKPLRLLYLRAFDESMVQIKDWVKDSGNPRYGKAESYNISLADLNSSNVESQTNAINRAVHWTRVIHVADNREASEVYGVPRMQPVYNYILDAKKVLGSSAEMFYKGGFPGLSIEIDPRVLDALDIEIDEDALKEDLAAYMNGMQRYLAIIGMSAKSLAPQVANPQGNIESILHAIAMALGVPLRIFMGSEQAQLASGQDVRTWNRRLKRRLERYVTPLLVRPFIDRLIMIGALPAPKRDAKSGMPTGGMYDYHVWWPDVNMPDEDAQSQIADRRAAALMKFMMSKSYKFIQPSSFLRFWLGFNQDEVDTMMEEAKGSPELPRLEELAEMEAKVGDFGGPADSGTRGKSPSKPPPGGVK